MSLATLGVDVYQLTTLLAHARQGRVTAEGTGQQVRMAFFFRKLPRQRNFVVTAGLRSIVEHCQSLRLSEDELRTIREHPLLRPALAGPEGRAVLRALESLDGFVGEIDAVAEGTLSFAGPARLTGGEPALAAGVPLSAYTPLLQVRTDMVLAKLIETPWLCRLNHMSMVASKAARVVLAARYDGVDRPVIEFGQRRTHPAAAIDAAYAAYLAGCRATSNLAATHVYGIPSVGTMDHFAVQAAERAELPLGETEASFFRTFCELFPHAATLLVDTYDTWGGIGRAVQAGGERLHGVRIDSNVTPETIQRARALLAELGAPHVTLFVSDALDEWRVRELARAGADGFGVGENITCSPDAAAGVGAVGKLVENGYGKRTMKISRGSGKTTLPGPLQAYRYSDHDLLALAEEAVPAGGRPLLQPLWRGRAPVAPLPPLEELRARVRADIDALPPHLRGLETDHGQPWTLVLSDGLYGLIQRLLGEATA
ncbi:MAG: hypothetical protein RMK29_08905 [Myxococcales bacterium]|nr:hypothetical protein [Myxococcota bacterium]MDW8281816.1 hypothetical protein [Myxococcales bacterium]